MLLSSKNVFLLRYPQTFVSSLKVRNVNAFAFSSILERFSLNYFIKLSNDFNKLDLIKRLHFTFCNNLLAELTLRRIEFQVMVEIWLRFLHFFTCPLPANCLKISYLPKINFPNCIITHWETGVFFSFAISLSTLILSCGQILICTVYKIL